MSSLTPHAPISLALSFFSRHLNRRERITRRLSLALLLLIACILPLATIAALADGGTTTLVSVNSAGTSGGNNDSYHLSISSDGRYVAFSSRAGDLTANDTNGVPDVFVRDTQSGTTTLVSVNSAGTASGNFQSIAPSISADGRYVAFRSDASNLAANDTNSVPDVFVRDTQSGTTTLVSVNNTGTAGGNNVSVGPSISSDGRYVAFWSVASDLTANDTNGTADVFVRDTQTGTTTLVSINSAGTEGGDGSSNNLSISADGRYVAFESSASNLTANDTNGALDMFVRDLQMNTTTLVSVTSDGTASNDGSYEPSISADGRYVAFHSYASNLTANDTNSTADVFVRDLQTNTTTLVSVNSAGTAGGDGASDNPSISADGRYVAFSSLASDLTANDTNGGYGDVFVRDLQTGTTSLVSVNNDGVIGNNHSYASSINSDGRIIAFISQATNFDARATNYIRDIYVRELLSAPAPSADLSVALYELTDPAVQGNYLGYNILLRNNSSDAATGVTLTVTLPTGITVNSIEYDSEKATLTRSGDTLTFNFATLPVGPSDIITVNGIAPSTPGMYPATATVTGNESDPDTSNNSSTHSTTVEPCTYTLSSNSQEFSASGGPGFIDVYANRQGISGNCPITATSNTDWITNVVLTDPRSSGRVAFQVASASSSRTGTLTIAGQIFTVTQEVGEACATASFETAATYGVPYEEANSAAVSDFNGDGKPDIATSSEYSENISVLLGDGVGGLGTATAFPAGNDAQAATAGDFNNDGKSDLVVGVSENEERGNGIAVILGNGAGGFGAAIFLARNYQPRSIAVGDFNNDGKADLAADGAILLGDGAGGFTQATSIEPTNMPNSLAVGDFNRDGKLDLAVAIEGSNNVAVKLGNGGGGFSSSTNYIVGTRPFAVAVDDLNGDGNLDLVTSNFSSNNISVLLGNGAGNFGAAVNFNAGITPYSVSISDFNGDRKPDLAVANYRSNKVSVLLGNGAGGFGALTDFAVWDQFAAMTVSDLNSDGKPDIITAHEESYFPPIGKFSVLLNNYACSTQTNAPAVSINPSNLNFGAQSLNTTSQPQTVTVTNTGDAPLHISNVETTGADANDFAVASNTCTAAIAPNATCTIGVTFTPSATDARSALLTLTDDAEGSPHSLLLEGGGSDPQASFNATSVDFGNQVAGASANFYRPTQDIIITNAGAGDLVIGNITLSGADASEFSFTSDALPITIPANSSTIVKARFAPTTPDFRYATLTFEDNAFDSPQTVDLYGMGVMAANLAFGRRIDVNGDGERQNRWTPVQISGLSDVAAFAGNRQHTLALRTDGTVWTWSNNFFELPPVQVSGLSDVKAIAAGIGHSLALKSDGTVWAWGSNTNGQLGDGTTTNRATPVQVSGLVNVVAVSTKNSHSLALKSDGTVRAWGSNDSGQLGDGTTTLRRTPVQVNNLIGVVAISASWDQHSMAAKADGSVWAWGYNSAGELGSGIPVESSSSLPVQVVGLSDVIAVALGQNHTLALKSDGTIWTMGSNGEGQLGTFPPEQTVTPVQVPDLTGVVAISAGSYHNLVLKSDGTVRAWGNCGHGQLGDGDTGCVFNSITPVQTLGIGGGVFIEAGDEISFAVAASPVVTLDSSGLDFGRQIINTASAEQIVTITNDGVGPLIINQNSGLIEGASRGDFTITANTCSTEVNPGDSCALSITFAPQGTGDKSASLVLYDNAFDSAQSIPLIGIGTRPVDLRLQNGSEPSPAHHNRDMTYYLRATNDGSSAATDVTMTDRLPTGLTFVSATPSQGSCAFAGGTMTCNLGTLAVGADAQVLLVVLPTRIGDVTNTANVTAFEVDPNPANNSATDITRVVPVADINVQMTGAPDPVTMGGTLTYTIVIENYGGDAATGVTLTDTIPAGTSFVSVRSNRGTCSGTTTVTCNIGTLANNATATVTLVVRPNTAGVIVNFADATANEYDPEPNNEVGVGTIVNAVADLAVTMTDAPDPVPLGSNVTYTIVVRNYGASSATGVVLSDTLPAGLTFVSAVSTQGTCAKTSTVNCTIGNLANNQTATVTLVATATAAGTLTNTASVSGAETDPNTSNNLNRQSTRVTTLTSLTLTPSTVTGACQTSTGKVTLSSPAPTGGAVVTLASLSAAASVPPSVTVPAGASSQTFIITTQSVAASQTATIRATLGATIKTATLTLKPLTVQAMTLTPNPAQGGTTVTGSVTLTCAATSPTTVTLSSSNTSVARPTSSSVVIAAGATTASFQVTTSATTVTRSTYINARAGGVTKSLSLTVTP